MDSRKNIVIIAASFLIIVSTSLYFLKKYYAPIQKDEFLKYQKEYVNRGFTGKIGSIKKYEGNKHYVDITILVDSTNEKIVYEKLSYSFQPLLINYISEGDVIIKKEKEETVTVVKKDGFYKSFVLY